MKILYNLSHGKGVVYGVGGRAKSLVREKWMSQDEVSIVQSPKNFCESHVTYHFCIPISKKSNAKIMLPILLIDRT